MEEKKGSGLTGLAAWGSFALSIIVIIWNAAFISAGAAQTERRVTQLEAGQDRRDDAISRIDTRTAKIETKLEILLPTNTIRNLEASR